MTIATLARWRDWCVDYGPLKGEVGDVKDIEVGCLCVPFRPEKFMITDDGDPKCSVTEILSFSIGGVEQPFPVGPIGQLPVPNDVNGKDIEGYRVVSGLSLKEISPPGTKSGFKVKFLKTATFNATMFGQAKIP